MNARDRSVPHKRPFAIALVLAALHYLSLVATAAAVFMFILRGDDLSAKLLAGTMILSTFTWVLSFMKRRTARCPLCKGTPYLESGAETHRKATRIFPLNHGTSAIVSSLFTQRFRCMFCGTRYDLLKPGTKRRH